MNPNIEFLRCITNVRKKALATLDKKDERKRAAFEFRNERRAVIWVFLK